jgi:hypothetical protein
MNDTLEYSFLAVGLFMVFHIGLLHSVEHNAYTGVRRQFGDSAAVKVVMQPAGFFGVENNHWHSISIDVENAKLNALPLYLYPHSSWRGEIDQLQLRLQHFSLSGLAVHKLTANIPSLTYDAAKAVSTGTLQLRSAGTGTARIWVGAPGLQEFIAQKYARLLRSVAVRISDGHIYLTADLNLLGSWLPFRGQFDLRVTHERFVYLTDPVVVLNHRHATAGLAEAVIKQVNPVLDTDLDLGLDKVFRLSNLQIEGNEVLFVGSLSLPVQVPLQDRKKVN